MTISAIACSSSLESELPVGLLGEHKRRAFVLLVMTSSICLGYSLNSVSAVVSIATGTPPAREINGL